MVAFYLVPALYLILIDCGIPTGRFGSMWSAIRES